MQKLIKVLRSLRPKAPQRSPTQKNWTGLRNSIGDEVYVLPVARKTVGWGTQAWRGFRYLILIPFTILAIMGAELYVGTQVLETVINHGVSITLLGKSIEFGAKEICLMLEIIGISVQTIPWDLKFRNRLGGWMMQSVFAGVIFLAGIINLAFLPIAMYGERAGQIIPSKIEFLYFPSVIMVLVFTVFSNQMIAGLIKAMSDPEPLMALGSPFLQEVCLTVAAVMVSFIRSVIMFAGLIGLSVVTWLLLDVSIRLAWPSAGDLAAPLFSTAVVAVELQMARQIAKGKFNKPEQIAGLVLMLVAFGLFAVSAVPYLMYKGASAPLFIMLGSAQFVPLYPVIALLVFVYVVLNQYLLYWYQISLNGLPAEPRNGEPTARGTTVPLEATSTDKRSASDNK